jgi:ATP-dependent RNA helicase RhlE
MPDKPKPAGTRGAPEPKKRPVEVRAGFAALGLIPPLLKACEDAGWITPTPVQQQAIPEVLAGHDLFGVAQTGTGKTAAYALPVLQLLTEKKPAPAFNPYCVVLAPTRELVQQIGEHFKP